jgi:hypothetical protein
LRTNEKKLSVLAALLFFSVQLGHTLLDQNNWPFCSYNMFSQVRPTQSQTFKIRLYEATGASRLVDVWEILPLEFFRAISVVREVYLNNNDTQTQKALASYILRALNEAPWGNFDQTYPSARPQTHFLGFDLLRVELDLREPIIKLGAETLLFSYREAP